MSVVELVDVRKQYQLGETRVEALRGLSLSIEKGEFLSVAGPSGSGKTTLLNMIGCMDSPSSGTVRVDGIEVERMSDTERTHYRRDKIGFIFQSFNLIPALNVYENIEFPLLLQGNCSRKDRERVVMHFVEEVGLEARVRSRPGEAIRRRATARGDRAGPGDPTRYYPGGRTDRQPRQRDRPEGGDPHAVDQRSREDHIHLLDPRSRGHEAGAAGSCGSTTVGSHQSKGPDDVPMEPTDGRRVDRGPDRWSPFLRLGARRDRNPERSPDGSSG